MTERRGHRRRHEAMLLTFLSVMCMPWFILAVWINNEIDTVQKVTFTGIVFSAFSLIVGVGFGIIYSTARKNID